MNRIQKIKISVIFAAIFFFVSTITGLAFWTGITLGFDKGFLKTIHKYSGLFAIVAVVFHASLHLSFIKTFFFKGQNKIQ